MITFAVRKLKRKPPGVRGLAAGRQLDVDGIIQETSACLFGALNPLQIHPHFVCQARELSEVEFVEFLGREGSPLFVLGTDGTGSPPQSYFPAVSSSNFWA